MNLKFFLLVGSLIISLSIYSQALNNQEIFELHNKIKNFIKDRDKLENARITRGSEFIICMLEINKNGEVAKICLLADEKNRDSTFSYLSQLRPSDFKDERFSKCKGRTIVIPVLSLGQGETPQYIKGIAEVYPVRFLKVLKNTKMLILVDALRYTAPHLEIEESQEQETVKKVEQQH